MARLPTVGGDNGNWGSVLNEFLGVAHNANGTLKHQFNVVDYGAAGNGTTDDTAAIQSAIDAAELVNGTVVIPPASTRYRITTSLIIDAPVALICFGKSSTIRQESWGVPALEIRSSDVRIFGEFSAETTATRSTFDGSALTASNNTATVKTESAGDPKSAGSGIYCSVDYDRLYIQRARLYGFIAGILFRTATERDVRIDSMYVDTVDFGIWGTPGINNSIGAVQAKNITRTQGVDEHVVYWTQSATVSRNSYIGSVEVDGIETPGAHAVSIKSVYDFYIGQITGTNIGTLFNTTEAKGAVGFMSSLDMTEITAAENGSVVLIQTNSDVVISGCHIEANVGGTNATTKSQVFACTTSSRLVVYSPRIVMKHATPGAVFRNSALSWIYNPVIEFDAALPSGIAAFMNAGTKSATLCLYIFSPYLRGSDQLLRPEAASDAYELDYNPNLVNGGAPTTSAVVSGTTTHHTRFIAEAETPSTLSSGTTQPQIRHSNVLKTANAGATTITRFQSGTNGQRFCLIAGDANTTIADNTDIILNGGTNLVMSSGQVIWFQFLEGKAYEINNTA